MPGESIISNRSGKSYGGELGRIGSNGSPNYIAEENKRTITDIVKKRDKVIEQKNGYVLPAYKLEANLGYIYSHKPAHYLLLNAGISMLLVFIKIGACCSLCVQITSMKYTFLVVVGLYPALLAGCSSKSSSNSKSNTSSSQQIYYESDEQSNRDDGYADGAYCATVEYYYHGTGSRSTYTLGVEMECNELTVIHWPNGGWLDNTHFSPPDISDGSATFTSDRGVDYTVEIIGKEGDCGLSGYAEDEDALIQQKEDEEDEPQRLSEEEREEEEKRMNEKRRQREGDEEEERRREQEEYEELTSIYHLDAF